MEDKIILGDAEIEDTEVQEEPQEFFKAEAPSPDDGFSFNDPSPSEN